MLSDASSPRLLRRRAAAGLAGSAVVLAAAVAVLYAVTVQTAVGQQQEDAVHSATRAGGEVRPWLLRAVLGPLAEGLEPVHLLAGLAVVAGLGALQRRWLRAGVAVGVVLVSLGLTELLKLVVLPRPPLASGSGTTLHNSLPSGHTTAVLAVALALLLTAPRWLHPPLVLAGALAAAAMAGTVVDEGWHRVSDPLASVLLTTAVWCAGAALLLLTGRHRPGAPRGWAVAGVGVVPPLASVAALVVVYVVPGTGVLVAVCAPAVVAFVTVLAAGAAAPGRTASRRASGGGRGAQQAGWRRVR